MKTRLLTNWTFVRVLYLIIGVSVIVESIISQQWIGIFLGSYLTSMGLFALGCASGNCYNGNCEVAPNHVTSTNEKSNLKK